MECMKEKQQSLPELWVHPVGHLRVVRDESVCTFGVLMLKKLWDSSASLANKQSEHETTV